MFAKLRVSYVLGYRTISRDVPYILLDLRIAHSEVESASSNGESRKGWGKVERTCSDDQHIDF